MNAKLKFDLENLPHLLQKTQQHSMEYLADLDDQLLQAYATKVPSDELPDEGLGAEGSLALFEQQYASLMVPSSGPRFWGYVTGGSTPASMMGDWLATVYDQNAQAIQGQGDRSANLELQTIQLLIDLFDLPKEKYFGGFVTGATQSNFTCLAVARQWYGKQIGIDIAKEGVGSQPIHILSATPHSSAVKALSMLGLGSANIIKVDTLEGDREAMCLIDLEKKLSELGQDPAIVITSGGTVNTVDFDDFIGIQELRARYSFWWHVDAAFGGFAACSPTYKHMLEGWGNADSITVDCHKWLNVPYESAIFLVDKTHSILQTESFQNSNAPYLGNPFDNFNYLNMLPENSRRLKALPAWFTLQAYGKEGYQEIVENCVALAKDLGEKIDGHVAFKLLAPVRLNNICFTLADVDSDQEVKQFLHDLNATGKVFMTPARFQGVEGIRCSLVNWRTSQADVDLVFEAMEELVKK